MPDPQISQAKPDRLARKPWRRWVKEGECGEMLTETTCVRKEDHQPPHTDSRRDAEVLDERDRLQAENTWLRNQMGDVRGMQTDGATPEEMDIALGRALRGERARWAFDISRGASDEQEAAT